jgi:hypothetical protein
MQTVLSFDSNYFISFDHFDAEYGWLAGVPRFLIQRMEPTIPQFTTSHVRWYLAERLHFFAAE